MITYTKGNLLEAPVEALVNTVNGKSIAPAAGLSEGIVKDGDILEVQPVLVAGIK